MTVNRLLRTIAGIFIMASVALGIYQNTNWFYFTVFVGLNLFQSGFTDKCPMMFLLRKFGVKD